MSNDQIGILVGAAGVLLGLSLTPAVALAFLLGAMVMQGFSRREP
jgi:hypothetical protein